MSTEGAFRTAFWILFVGVLLMRAYFAVQVRRAGERLLPNEEAVEREGRGMFIARLVLFLMLVTWLMLYALNPLWMENLAIPLPGWLRWAGFILGLGSLAFWTWTQTTLGKHWSAQLQLREEHHLLTTGPYAWMRHPLYTAMFGWAVGVALVTANWVFVAMTVLSVAGTLARVPREERMMIEEFGQGYQAYMHRTGRYFPRLARRGL